MIARLLCWLGFHDWLLISSWSGTQYEGAPGECWGYETAYACARCDKRRLFGSDGDEP